MKQLITLLITLLISVAVFPQKDQLKAAGKAIEANNFKQALSSLQQAEPLIENAKDKYKTQYYFLLGKALYANGTTPDNFEEAAKAFNTLLNLEKKGRKKYSPDAQNIIANMLQKVADNANKNYNEAREFKENDNPEKAEMYFAKAAENFKQVYILSPRDTIYLQNAGLAYYFAKEYEKSIGTYQKLLDLGYTGIATTYTATSLVNEQRISYPSKAEMDKAVRLKIATDPEVKVRPSQRNELKKMIAKNHIALEDHEKALEAILEAKKTTPDDYGLLVDEANIYYAMGDHLKFKEKLEEAVKVNPTDPHLFYNIGVMKMKLGDNEGAIDSFNKAIELKPDYAEAYNNIGAAILSKAEPIVEEMNNNLSNFDKYDQLQAQQLAIYREAMPYYEKAYEFKPEEISVVQVLLGIYENLELYEKQKKMKAIYDSMRN